MIQATNISKFSNASSANPSGGYEPVHTMNTGIVPSVHVDEPGPAPAALPTRNMWLLAAAAGVSIFLIYMIFHHE